MFRFWLVLGLALGCSSFAQCAVEAASPALPEGQSVTPSQQLQRAVRASRLDDVQRWVNAGADVNARDAVGSSPLLMAASAGDTDIASYLLKHGADANTRQQETGATPLLYAVQAGNLHLVELLAAAKANLNFLYFRNRTILHVAAIRGDEAILEKLLSAADATDADASNVDTPDNDGNTALDEAILHGRTRAASILLKHGADPRRVHSSDGRGPLHEACIKGLAATVTSLIEAGANPSCRDTSGQTPLDLALDYKNRSVIATLLHLEPKFPALQADFSEAAQSAAAKGRTEMLRMLIESGFDVNRPTASHSSYLNIAALQGRPKVVRLLLDHGAQTNVRSETGSTPLHDAALSGNVEVINTLLDHGSEIDSRDAEEQATPLMFAASFARTEAAIALLQRGANYRLKDRRGRTALDRAQAVQDTVLVQLLQNPANRAPQG